ncbi:MULTISPECIES: helix-turn-helix domain-containing protein [Bradyrhizobium]|uniref:helix-turn-helix domain-containing protein n=1 Tax=Bradyrhizobium elkanii TaxID=29448 RepID=UPI0018AD3038|nr:AraC family transcriptional regulator [Bradyrhizobium elkanii]
MTKFGQVRWAQKDGSPPTTSQADGPAGESGVRVFRALFDGGAHFSATPDQHLVFLQMSPHLQLDCRIAGRQLRHETTHGALAICPAGIDSSADADGTADMLLVAVKPTQLALAAAEDYALEAELPERLSGYDQTLQQAAQSLAAESAQGYPNGPLFWSEAASRFIGRLVSNYTSTPRRPIRGRLGQRALQRIRDYVLINLAEPIEVADLAALAGRSSFHFSRVFTRSVGMTPYRYVVHLRLQAAARHMREGRMGLAEIAVDTGFADQSHLSRWVRRVYGVAPSEFT